MNATPALQALAEADAESKAAQAEMAKMKEALDAKAGEVQQLKLSVAPFAEAVLAEEGVSALANPMVAAQAVRAFRVRRTNQENFRNLVRGSFPNSDSPAVTVRLEDDRSNSLLLHIMLTGQDVAIPLPKELPAIFDALSAEDSSFHIRFSTQRLNESYEDSRWEAIIKSAPNQDMPYMVTTSGYGNSRELYATFEDAMNAALSVLRDTYRPVIPTTGDIQVSYAN